MPQNPRPLPAPLPAEPALPPPAPLAPPQLWALLTPPQRQPLLTTLARLWRTLPPLPPEVPHDAP